MTEKLANWFVGLFGGLASLTIGKYVIVFIISMIPILELRGGMIAASLLDLNPWISLLVSVIGNILPIPFILWFITKIFKWMKNFKRLAPIVEKLERKAHKNKAGIEKYGYLGIFLFVAIPLPGTGAWTGCLIAALLEMDKKKSALAAAGGVVVAGIIMLIFSFGILGNLIR